MGLYLGLTDVSWGRREMSQRSLSSSGVTPWRIDFVESQRVLGPQQGAPWTSPDVLMGVWGLLYAEVPSLPGAVVHAYYNGGLLSLVCASFVLKTLWWINYALPFHSLESLGGPKTAKWIKWPMNFPKRYYALRSTNVWWFYLTDLDVINL
jgi:hypothetical protein